MISSEKNSAGPTALQPSMMARTRAASLFGSARRSNFLCAFSTITTAASISSPMAMAIPPRLMMFELMPSQRMQMKEKSTDSGSTITTTAALRACSRNSTHTSATISDSCQSVSVSVAMAS